jgi:hypothetical protein
MARKHGTTRSKRLCRGESGQHHLARHGVSCTKKCRSVPIPSRNGGRALEQHAAPPDGRMPRRRVPAASLSQRKHSPSQPRRKPHTLTHKAAPPPQARPTLARGARVSTHNRPPPPFSSSSSDPRARKVSLRAARGAASGPCRLGSALCCRALAQYGRAPVPRARANATTPLRPPASSLLGAAAADTRALVASSSLNPLLPPFSLKQHPSPGTRGPRPVAATRPDSGTARLSFDRALTGHDQAQRGAGDPPDPPPPPALWQDDDQGEDADGQDARAGHRAQRQGRAHQGAHRAGGR